MPWSSFDLVVQCGVVGSYKKDVAKLVIVYYGLKKKHLFAKTFVYIILIFVPIYDNIDKGQIVAFAYNRRVIKRH